MEAEADLAGRTLPHLSFASTQGTVELAELAQDLLVLFVYPHATGLTEPPVAGWDDIPGARGCTAQSCGFRDHHAQLTALGAELAGLSVQTVEEQRSFASRVSLRYRLISDPTLRLAAALELPTFTADGRTFYRRLTLIAQQSRIKHLFYPVSDPEANASQVVELLESQRQRTPQPSAPKPNSGAAH